MTSIEPELWVDGARDAIAYYEAAFGATVLHRVGDGDEIVAQLAVGEARFWISSASADRRSPRMNRGATGRVLLVVEDPDAVVAKARAAGASELSAVKDEHGWRLGRIEDPSGHEWEIGRPLGVWPPDRA
jgi:PhnB protein